MRLSTLWILICIFAVQPAFALLPNAPDPAAEQLAASQTIEADVSESDDAQIAERIRGFYGAMDGFEAIEVRAQQGVVTLSGTLASQDDIAEAERLASQVDGVVTVQNQIDRDISVEENLGALSGLSERIASFAALLPLLLTAGVVALLLGLLGYLIAGFKSFWRKVTPNVFLADLVASAIRFVFVVGGLVIALDMIGAGALLGAVLGGAGVVGIALGFAMRDTVENYVASLMLSLRQPFRANDHVLIDDLEGRIIRLTSRATIMMTLDGNHLRIPNSTVFKAIILNFTTNPRRRFDFELGIDADDDPNKARQLGRETLQLLGFVLQSPEPEGRVINVGDSNIVIRYLGWIDQNEVNWHRARSRAIAAVKSALEDAGFGLPEPIYRLRFDARTNPLPFENVQGVQSKSRKVDPKPVVASAKVESDLPDDDDSDVGADDAITRMVEEERAETSEADDLLDANRPAE